MLRRIFVYSLVALGLFAGTANSNRAFAAESEGQADLDKATELKLTAETFEDLGAVINLTQSAISRGLDASNGDFAKKLLASSLVQRASAYSHVIFDKKPLDVRWNQIRQAALVDLERAIKNDNSSSEAQYMISRLQSLPGGNVKRALDAANEAIKLAGNDDRLKSKSLVLRAGLTEDKKKQLEDLDEAIKILPGDVEALRMRGVYHLTQNKADLALKDLDEAAKADPKQIDIHEARGLTLTVLKKYDDAIKAFDKVLELEPEAYIAMLHRGRAKFLKGDPKSALADLNTAAEKNENNPAILYLRARVHQQLGDTKEALSDIEEAVQLQSGLGPAFGLRAILAAGSGEYTQAIEDLQELRKIAPQNVELMVQLGTLYTISKQHRRAIETYNDVLTADPKNFTGYRGRADANLGIGKQDVAIADYEEAMKINAEDPGVLNNLAWVLCTSPNDKLRDGKRAVDLAKQACTATSNKQAHILSTLAAAYAEVGEWDEAKKWAKSAVDAGTPEQKDELAKEAASYEDKKPWRELQQEPEDGPAKP